jgi:CubicO group peptidase (beta-lactamase class C family)
MSDFDNVIKEFLEMYETPGASVAVSRGGRLEYEQGYGYPNNDNPNSPVMARPQSLFRIASISKPITSATILKLYEQGKLNLDDKVFGREGLLNSRFPFRRIPTRA